MTGFPPSATELIERYSEDKQLESPVTIPPHLIRLNLAHVIQDRLVRQIQGRCTSQDGFIIKLKKIVDIKGGAIEQRSGSVNYTVRYVAQCLRPHASHLAEECEVAGCKHSGDVVEAIVTRLLKIGLFADLGPLSIFVPIQRMPEDTCFDMNTGQLILANGDAIKQQSLIRIRIEQIQMLDDSITPSNTTSCVLKAMGTFVG